MTSTSSERVTSLSNKSVLTWNDVVSAAKSCKESILSYFLTNFQCFELFSIGQTFTSDDQLYWSNCLKWIVTPLKGWPVSWRRVSLLETICYRLQKIPKSAPGTFFDKFLIFWAILVKFKLSLLMTVPAVRIGSNELYSNELCLLWKGDQFLSEKYFCLKQSVIGCIKFQKVHPEPSFDKFSVFWAVLVLAKLLLLMTDPTVWIS